MTPPRRPQSQTERDVASFAARKERDAAPAFVDEDLTGRYEGEELYEARKARAADDPAARIVLLETEQKTLSTDVGEMKVSIAEIRGDQKAHGASLLGIQKTLDQFTQREHVTFTAKVDVDTAKQLDAIDAGKARRDFWLKMATSSAVGAIVLKLLQHWGVL
jgi:hypothetical protein